MKILTKICLTVVLSAGALALVATNAERVRGGQCIMAEFYTGQSCFGETIRMCSGPPECF